MRLSMERWSTAWFLPLLPLSILTLLGGCSLGKDAERSLGTRANPGRTRGEIEAQAFADATRGLTFRDGRVQVEPLESRDPPAPDLSLARELLAREKGWEALTACTQALRSGSRRPAAYRELARVLRYLERSDLALAAMETARTHDDAPETLHQHAMLLAEHQDYPAAIATMQAFLDQGGAPRLAHARLAIWHHYAGNPGQARRHAQLAEESGHPVPSQLRRRIGD